MIPKEELEDMYLVDGMTQTEIADMIGVDQRTISNWMRLCEIKPRRVYEMISKEELRSMYWDYDMTQTEIGDMVGVAPITISMWMRICGIEARTFSELKSGENSNWWKGGITEHRYCEKFNKSLRKAVRERDNYECQYCGKTQKENGRKLAVHHVHYDKDNCYPDLISLCSFCHNTSTNGNRDEWEELCMILLEDRGLLNWKPNYAK